MSGNTVDAPLPDIATQWLHPDAALRRDVAVQAEHVVQASRDRLLKRALRGIGRLRRRTGENWQGLVDGIGKTRAAQIIERGKTDELPSIRLRALTL